jgi:hypothetical protein
MMAGIGWVSVPDPFSPSSVGMRWERTAGDDLLAVSLAPAHHPRQRNPRQRSPALCGA